MEQGVVGLGWLLLTLSVIDLRTLTLPDVLTLPLIPLGLALAFFNSMDQGVTSLIGAAVGGVGFWAIGAIYRKATGRTGLGFGDVKLMAGVGAWVGWSLLHLVLLQSSILALLAVAILGARPNSSLMTNGKIAFGPFIAIGLWTSWIYSVSARLG